jgi:hypothetical protein
MKIYKLSLFVCAALFLFACEKETEDLSRPTYYVVFDIQGDNPAIAQAGEEYLDAGVIATLQGKDVTSTITVKSNVDYNEMGMYKVEYTAVNADGLKSRAVRDVIVCNPSVTTNLAGRYVTQEGTERLSIASGALVAYPGYHTTITYLAPGFFSVNDFLGGYYAERTYPQYGYSVMGMSGYFSLNEDNTIDLISSYIDAWGDALDKLENAKYDPATGEITWDAYYAGSMKFHVILNK